MNIGNLEATLGVDTAPLKRAETELRSFASTADNQFSSVIGKAAALAASLLTVSAAIKAVTDAATTGMKVETMGVVMTQIGKNVGVSSEALKYFTEQVKSAGVTGMEAMSAISKAMVLGLNLNQMKEFTTRVRDIAVGARDAEGNLLNTSQTLMRVMHGIESGQVEILRTMGISVRAQDEVYKAYGETIGKTKEQMNTAEKAQAMLNEVMRASEPLTGAAAAADETVGKQLASMARFAEEAKVSLWELFKPAMIAGVQALTQGFKDIKTWAEANSLELRLLGQSIGEYATAAGSATLEAGKWLLVNKDLVITIGEFYLAMKSVGLIVGFANAILELNTAIKALQASFVMVEVTTSAWAIGVASCNRAVPVLTGQVYGLSAAMSALDTAMGGVILKLSAVMAAAGIYGAVKSFQGKGDTGQGIGSPGTATMGVDMWEYVNRKEEKGFDVFQKDRTKRLENMIGGGQSYISKMSDALGLQGQVAAGLAGAEADLSSKAAMAKLGGAGKGGGGGGAGKALEAAESSLKSFIETMNQETARGAGDSEAILNAWYGKQALTLDKLAAKNIDVTLGKQALDAAYFSKLEKLNDTFNDWYSSAMGNQYEQLVGQERNKLAEVAGNKAKEAQVIEAYDRKHFDLSQQIETDRVNLFKGYLDTMAGLTPVLADQLGYKREALALELKLADAALDRSLREGKITQDTYEQAQAMQAVVAQAKKYNLEMEHNKGISGWAWSRGKEADQRNQVQDIMEGIESKLGGTIGQSIVDSLTGKQVELKELFKNIMGEAITWVYKFNAQTLMDYGAKLLSPKQENNIGNLASIKKPQQTALEKRIDATELKGLNLEIRTFKEFGTEVSNFSKATDQFGKFSQTGLTTYDNLASQMSTSFPQLSQASLGLQSTINPITGAASESSLASAAGTVSSIAAGAAAAGMALSAIGMLTSSKELSMAGMVISTAAAILQTAAMIMMAAAAMDSIPFFHSGGVIYAHTGWPRLRSDEVPIIAQTGERVLSRGQNRDYEAGMAAGGGGGGSVIYSPTYHINAIDARGIEAVLAKHAKTMTKVINREVGRRGRHL